MPSFPYAVRRNLENQLSDVARRALRLLGVPNSAVAVFLLEEREMKRLKAGFLKTKPRQAVDVLAFPEPAGFPHPEESAKFLGEIYLNRRLAEQGTGRLRYLLIHGLLHLLGYSHQKKNDIMKMEKLERRILKQIGN